MIQPTFDLSCPGIKTSRNRGLPLIIIPLALQLPNRTNPALVIHIQKLVYNIIIQITTLPHIGKLFTPAEHFPFGVQCARAISVGLHASSINCEIRNIHWNIRLPLCVCTPALQHALLCNPTGVVVPQCNINRALVEAVIRDRSSLGVGILADADHLALVYDCARGVVVGDDFGHTLVELGVGVESGEVGLFVCVISPAVCTALGYQACGFVGS